MALDSLISVHGSSVKELDFLLGPYNEDLVSLRSSYKQTPFREPASVETHVAPESPQPLSARSSQPSSSLSLAEQPVYSFKPEEIVWRNVILFGILHASAIKCAYLVVTGEVYFSTIVFAYFYGLIGAIGITAGAHRLWSHGAYKAKLPLRCLLIVMQTMAFQNCVWEWVRDHRVHHKHTDTNADPHNFSRGFFFAHMGWLMVRKHPLVKEKGAGIDMGDIERDPVCMFQKRHYVKLMILLAFLVPYLVMRIVFGQAGWTAFHMTAMRYFMSLHYAWLVNSAAHSWGDKPFDSAIKPTDNKLLAIVTIGEGWHNYHHIFPWDYKAAELGNYAFNLTTSFIDFFAWIGWAYDLKVVSNPMICKRALRTGDGSYDFSKHRDFVTTPQAAVPHPEDYSNELFNMDHENMLWGWRDKDLPELAKKYVDVRNRLK